MSQKATRKTVPEEKDKKPDSPVIELKSKSTPSKSATREKSIDKTEKAKTDKAAEKTSDKKVDKNGTEKEKDSKEKGQEKSAEKTVKPSTSQPKPKDGTNTTKPKEDTTAKPKDGTNTKPKEDTTAKPKDGPNGPKSVTTNTNGTEPKTPEVASNGTSNGTSPHYSPAVNGAAENGVGTPNEVVSVSDSDDDCMFPELTYDESDVEREQEKRSLTRRAQVVATRTPETPRPASDKADKDKPTEGSAVPKDVQVLQLKDGVTDRKLRSADSPKPETKKADTPKKETTSSTPKDKDTNGVMEVEVTVEIESEDEPRKTDTNYSKSRVKVSPYRRSGRLADQTTTSIQANYTGNNTTMETDISVCSATEDATLDDSYLRTIRNMRGRRSYKLLKDIQITPRPKPPVVSEPSRPTAPVVGRKRKPEAEDLDNIEQAAEVLESPPVHSKRMRLGVLDRILPFRRSMAPIVGINTDLPYNDPLSVVARDPETLKDVPPPRASPTDGKRCSIM